MTTGRQIDIRIGDDVAAAFRKLPSEPGGVVILRFAPRAIIDDLTFRFWRAELLESWSKSGIDAMIIVLPDSTQVEYLSEADMAARGWVRAE